MVKNYFLLLILALMLFTTLYSVAQNPVNKNTNQEYIEGLSIYPNPVNRGKTYINITSKHKLTKNIEFYNVLGKQILSIHLTTSKLNISNLSKGVYVLKVTENNISETRKLVIN